MYGWCVKSFTSRANQVSINLNQAAQTTVKWLASRSASVFTNFEGSQDKKRTVNLGSIKEVAKYSTSQPWRPPYKTVKDGDRILAIEGNRNCSDCSSSDVQYVSILNGAVYCPVCTGIHRQIGIHPHFLPLKGELNLSNEDMQFYESMGNNHVNNIYEASLDIVGADKPTVSSSKTEIETYIRKKYLECSFSISRYDRSATENVLHFVSNMRARGRNVPNLRQKVAEKAGATYEEIMDEAFDTPYALHVAE